MKSAYKSIPVSTVKCKRFVFRDGLWCAAIIVGGKKVELFTPDLSKATAFVCTFAATA